MTKMTIALLWAAVILGTALAARSGKIALETAEALTFLLPALAIATLGTSRCNGFKGAAA